MKTLDLNVSFKNKIKEYCLENNLNFDLLVTMNKIWGIDMLKFEKNSEIVLEVLGYGDNLTFEQTEYTKQYLGM